eukprot:scaffold1638_cov258-Pinguiococcus_pyrenoidosus.AAC.101
MISFALIFGFSAGMDWAGAATSGAASNGEGDAPRRDSDVACPLAVGAGAGAAAGDGVTVAGSLKPRRSTSGSVAGKAPVGAAGGRAIVASGAATAARGAAACGGAMRVRGCPCSTPDFFAVWIRRTRRGCAKETEPDQKPRAGSVTVLLLPCLRLLFQFADPHCDPTVATLPRTSAALVEAG